LHNFNASAVIPRLASQWQNDEEAGEAADAMIVTTKQRRSFYIDGHEQDEVVVNCKRFCKELSDDKTTQAKIRSRVT
jgi:hypothetical protein